MQAMSAEMKSKMQMMMEKMDKDRSMLSQFGHTWKRKMTCTRH